MGTTRPCCLAHDEITDEQGNKYDLKTIPLETIYRSKYMKDLRQQFRRGDKPATCNRCWEEESAGRDSKRIHTQVRLKELYKQVDWANDDPDQLWFIDLKLGNICKQWDLLHYAAENNLSGNIDIHYNTNATQWPKDPRIWKKFRRVDIAFSVDNVGDRFEFERYGADWTEANRIIDATHVLRATSVPNITTQLCFTINIQNVYYLDELLAWADTKGFGSIYFNMMHSPDHMSIQYMTPNARELVLNKLKTTFWASKKYQQEIDGVINFIEAGPGSDGSEFLRQMKRTDAYRQQNFTDTHPEIAQAMGYE
jgi:hypothetical protein